MAYDFQAALQSGLDENKIRSYLAQKGREKEADKFFGEKKSLAGFGKNILTSGAELVKGTVGAVTSPVETAKGLGSLAAGGVEKLIPGEQGQEKSFDALISFYKERYGSLQKAKETAYKDPVGFALDIAPIVGAVGKGIQVAGVAGKVGKATQVLKATLPKIPSGAGTIAKAQEAVAGIGEAEARVLNPLRGVPQARLASVQKGPAIERAQGISQKYEGYLKQAEKAAVDFSQSTPLDIAGQKASDALNGVSAKLTTQGKLKSQALEQSADKLVKGTGEVKQELRNLIDERFGVYISKTGELLQSPGRISKLSQLERALLKDIWGKLDELGKHGTAKKVDDFIDYAQNELYSAQQTGVLPLNTPIESVLKNITSNLNSRLKDVVGQEYKMANQKYASYIKTRNKLNKVLGPEGERGGALMKQLFSPSGERPRRLFRDVKKITGLDLTQEATLAKFAMEAVGDARQSSMLEALDVLRSATGGSRSFVEKAVQALIKRSVNKKDIGRKIIQQGVKSI